MSLPSIFQSSMGRKLLALSIPSSLHASLILHRIAGDTVVNATNPGTALPELTVGWHDPASLHESSLTTAASGGRPSKGTSPWHLGRPWAGAACCPQALPGFQPQRRVGICGLDLHRFSFGLKAGRPVSSPGVRKCWRPRAPSCARSHTLRVPGQVPASQPSQLHRGGGGRKAPSPFAR